MKCKVTQAGAGTGKTTSLINEVYRFYVEYRAKNNKHPHVVLTTFTRKATQELRERIIKKAISEKSNENEFLEFALSNNNLHISTIHGIASLFLRQYAGTIGFDSNFKVMHQSNNLEKTVLRKLLKENMDLLEDYRFDELLDYVVSFYKKYSENPDIKPATRKDLEKCIQYIKNKDKKEISYFEKTEKVSLQFDKLGKLFCSKFYEEKQKKGILSIDDLELLMLKCIREHKDLVKEFSGFWDYWLIDEYQDTSPIQDLILDKLSHNTNRFYVGDPQQSIYSFRDAREEVFFDRLEKTKDILSLKDNYRSNSALVNFFNAFFGSHKGKSFVTLGSKSGKKIPDYPVCTFIICDKDNKKFPQEKAVSDEIVALLNKGAKAEEVCVLCQTNDQLAKISKNLDQHRVPTLVHSSQAFNNRKEIKDLKIVIKFLLNPHDNINFISFLRMPWVKVGEDIIFQIGKSVQSVGNVPSYWRHVKTNKVFKSVSDELEKLFSKVNEVGITETVREFCVQNGFIDDGLLYDESGRREANIWKFLLKLKEHEPEFNFLDLIDEEEYQYDEDSLDSNHGEDAVSAISPGMVNLMTIHKAKGLEFKHVFIAFFDVNSKGNNKPIFALDEETGKWTIPYNLDETKKSSALAKKIKKYQEKIKDKEKDRMLYVAMTRAIDSLHIFVNENGLEDKDKTSGYWVKNFDWDFTLGKFKNEHYTYEVRKAKGLNDNIDSNKSANIQIPSKLKHDVLVKKAVGDFLEEKFFYSGKSNVLSNIRKTNFGIKFHRVMQLVQSGIQCDLSSIFGSDEIVSEVKDAMNFLKNLKTPPFMKIFEVGETEWWFMKKLKNVVLEGRIDLWGTVDDEIWVIDYKTGSSANYDIALKQLALYSLVLKDVFAKEGNCKKEIKIAAVYPMEKKVVMKDSKGVDEILQNLNI